MLGDKRASSEWKSAFALPPFFPGSVVELYRCWTRILYSTSIPIIGISISHRLTFLVTDKTSTKSRQIVVHIHTHIYFAVLVQNTDRCRTSKDMSLCYIELIESIVVFLSMPVHLPTTESLVQYNFTFHLWFAAIGCLFIFISTDDNFFLESLVSSHIFGR